VECRTGLCVDALARMDYRQAVKSESRDATTFSLSLHERGSHLAAHRSPCSSSLSPARPTDSIEDWARKFIKLSQEESGDFLADLIPI